ncbi:MAG: TraR/DksA family transcriptional regulator [Planctomycetota bacterium]
MAEEKIKEARLSPQEIEEFKAMLLAKQYEILSNVVSMEDETLRKENSNLSNMPIHMADIGTDNFDLENTLNLMESERKILAEIGDALTRIEDGTYGICEGRGEPIPKERLQAIPWARYCVACAGLLEKGLVIPEDDVEEIDSGDNADNRKMII